MYKVFFNDRIIFLTAQYQKQLKDSPDCVYHYSDKKDLMLMIDKFENNKDLKKLYIFYKDLKELQLVFKSCFNVIEAAGGLVKNKNQQLLIIKRHNKWDLPKGKVKKGEDYKKCAIREVTEECGIHNLKIVDFIQHTYHSYRQDNNRILKKTYWYEMYYDGSEPLIPQKEEDITEVKWLAPSEIHTIFDNTYLSVIDVLNFALRDI